MGKSFAKRGPHSLSQQGASKEEYYNDFCYGFVGRPPNAATRNLPFQGLTLQEAIDGINHNGVDPA